MRSSPTSVEQAGIPTTEKIKFIARDAKAIAAMRRAPLPRPDHVERRRNIGDSGMGIRLEAFLMSHKNRLVDFAIVWLIVVLSITFALSQTGGLFAR